MTSTSALPPLPPPHLSTTAAAAATTTNLSLPDLSPPSPTLKTPTIRSRLSRLCQEGQPHLARQLFDTIPRPTTVLWNTIIIGFICNNMPEEALFFYSQMKTAAPRVQCDSYTYSSTLKACAEMRNLRAGKAVHGHFIRCQSNPSRIVYNSLLNMYSSCLSGSENEMRGDFYEFDYSRYELVRKVFDTMRKRNVVAWNTMVSWYVKTERFLDAVRQFRIMIKMGIKPSPVSFVNVFPAISSLRRKKMADVFYGLLLKLGDEFVNDLFVLSSAILMYAELGYLDIAKKIFDHCLEKNTEVWNTMIGAYVQNDRPIEGIEIFIQALELEQTKLDDVTFLSVLNAVSQLQRLDFAFEIYAFVIKRFKELPINILNAIVVMYTRCNSIDTAFSVFDKMLERDIVSWNTMISAFVQNRLDEEALMLVYEMQRQGFTADHVTVTALLSAASNLKSQRVGKQVHAYLLRNALQFEGMSSYLIDMYSKSGLVRNAQKIFSNYISDRDQATWNAMISGYAQNGFVDEVFATLQRMLTANILPNAVTVASLLPVSNAIGSLSFGKQLHGFSIRHLLDQNVFVGTALIDMYSKLGAIKDAETVFNLSMDKNSVTYTSMILGYGQHGMSENALSLFHSMKDLGIEPDGITFIAVLSACSHAGLVQEGLQIFASMEIEYNIKPSHEHYCCIVDMLGRVGRVAEAFEFVKELGEDGNSLPIWGSLLSACRIHRQFELGEVIAKKMGGLDAGNNVSGYQVLLSNIYAEGRNWKNVDRVREEMRKKGLRKEVGSSWIDIAGCINYFVSKDQKHHLCDEIYDTLEVLATEMRKSGYRPSSHTDDDGMLE